MKNIVAIFLLFSLTVFSGCGLKGSSSNYEAILDIWGVFDNSNAYSEIFTAYSSMNDHVAPLNYQKHTLESYKDDLLSALAAGNGPDIFMIHNSWLPDFQDKVVPVPNNMITEAEFYNNFVDVAATDMIIDGQIYGVPLSVDSLGLYYNKDIFNAAGITRAPRTWEEFDDVVEKLTRIDEFGNIDQSAVSMGTAFNVNRSSDLLTLLMIQNGAEISNKDSGDITFGEPVQGNDILPSGAALEYYTDFASATSPLYTWNKDQGYSIDEFFQGQTAMTINYSYHYDTIKAKNAKLNFATADLPQMTIDTTGNQANYANYWFFVVAKNKQPTQSNESNAVEVTNDMRVHESWQLLKAMSFPSESGVTLVNYINGEAFVGMPGFDLTENYLEKTGKPAARRDLIDTQIDDVQLGAFARGNLIARSWWRHDADAVDALFADMIDSVNTGELSVFEAINQAATRVKNLQ